MARDLAIDLGTANTLVYERGRGIVLNEPTVIALNERTHEVLAMGHEAWQMIGRTPGYIVAVRPLRQGAITDFDITQRMIRLLLHRVGVNRFNRPRVVICVPSAITEVERRAVTEAARRAGAADAQLIEQPMAAAIGAGLPDPRAGRPTWSSTSAAARRRRRSSRSAASWPSRPSASAASTSTPPSPTFIRREYGIAVGERTAEEIKIAIGSACAGARRGQGRGAGPRPHERPAQDDHPLARGGARGHRRAGVGHLDSVVACLGMSPPELAQDLILNGACTSSAAAGCSPGLDQRLANETEVPVHLVDAPLECVVLGAGRCIEAYDSLKVMFMGSNR